MKLPLRYALVLASLMVVALPAAAQTAPVATLGNISGNVMVSSGASMVSAVPGPLAPGQTIVVAEGGSVTVTTQAGTQILSAGTYTVGANGAISGGIGMATTGGTGAGAGGVGGGFAGSLGGASTAAGLAGAIGALGALQANQNSKSEGADDIIDPAVSK